MKLRRSCAKTVTDKVVDASAIVALLFDEPSQSAVVRRLSGAALFAPALLEFEVGSACLKKIRARPAERDALIEACSLFRRLWIALCEIDIADAIVLAERTRLSLYDACYLWLSRALRAELVTLDLQLAKAEAATR